MTRTNLAQLNPKRILVCQLKQIGDVLLTTPCFELLKKRWPDAELHVLTYDYCAPVLENNPHVHKIWPLPGNAGLLGSLPFLLRAARRKYDLAVDFQQLPRCRQAMLLCDAPVRLTFTPKRGRSLFYTHWTKNTGTYATAMKSSILAPLGIEWNLEKPRLYLSEAEKEWADKWYAGHGVSESDLIVTVDASHRHETHRWFPERYAEVMRLAAAERPELKFVLLYGPGEKTVAEEVSGLANLAERCLVPEKQTTLRELSALMSRARVHLGNCSAPRHFAVALDVPSLTVIGGNGTTAWQFPSLEHQIAHLYIDCHKCNESVCPNGSLKCLRDLPVNMVLDRLLAMLDHDFRKAADAARPYPNTGWRELKP
jgi:ADP-heptose:LPS heptosyltransferase